MSNRENIEIKWECEHCKAENNTQTVFVPNAIAVLTCSSCKKSTAFRWVKDPRINKSEGIDVRPDLMVHTQADKTAPVKAAMGTGISWEIKDDAGNPVSGGQQ